MPKRLIKDILAQRSLISADKNMTVRTACRLMVENKIGAVLVLEDRRIVGIFTERDVLKKIMATSVDPDATALYQVMAREPQTIRADKPLGYALHMMAEGGFRHVPVVDGNDLPVGMVSARDALGQDIVEFERELKRLEELEGSIGY